MTSLCPGHGALQVEEIKLFLGHSPLLWSQAVVLPSLLLQTCRTAAPTAHPGLSSPACQCWRGTALTSTPADSQGCRSGNSLPGGRKRDSWSILRKLTGSIKSLGGFFWRKQRLLTAEISLAAQIRWTFESSWFDIPAGCCGMNSGVTRKQSVSNSLFFDKCDPVQIHLAAVPGSWGMWGIRKQVNAKELENSIWN